MVSNDQPQSRKGEVKMYGDAIYTAVLHVGISPEQMDRLLGTLQMCGWELAPRSERAAMDTPKWTALSDETLPPDGHDVLVYTATGLVKDESPMQVRSLWRARKSGEACYYTHWMPTPKAPSCERPRDA